MNNKVAVIIPARYKSTRFPGKPLVDILGKPMIIRVADLSTKAVGKENVYVATDDKKIGTEVSFNIDADIIVNVQGDEALLDPNDIIKVIEQKNIYKDSVITCMAKLTSSESPENLKTCKVVTNLKGELMYVSRNPIPSSKRGIVKNAYKQICIYAFNKKQLKDYYDIGKELGKTPNESSEDIEIIRFLEIGIKVQMIEVKGGTLAVDFPEDVIEVEKIFRKQQLYLKLDKKSKKGVR